MVTDIIIRQRRREGYLGKRVAKRNYSSPKRIENQNSPSCEGQLGHFLAVLVMIHGFSMPIALLKIESSIRLGPVLGDATFGAMGRASPFPAPASCVWHLPPPAAAQRL